MVRGREVTPMTTTTEPASPSPKPGAFARAEAGSRQIVMQVGFGVVAFIVGSIFSAGAGTRIMERFDPIESEAVDLVVRALFERLWLFFVLPFVGYGVGRFTEITPVRFALTAGLSGELFAVLLVAGMNGFDYLIDDGTRVVLRLVTLFVGLTITLRAVIAGRAAAGLAQAKAQATADARKQEYAEFLQAAEQVAQKSEAPPAEVSPAPAAEPPKENP